MSTALAHVNSSLAGSSAGTFAWPRFAIVVLALPLIYKVEVHAFLKFLYLRSKTHKDIVTNMLEFLKEQRSQNEPAGYEVLRKTLKDLKQRLLRRS